MYSENKIIVSAAFNQSPIREIGPNASEINVSALADQRVKRLLDAVTSLCTALAEHCFPEQPVTFLHSDFVTATNSGMQHTSNVYLHEDSSETLMKTMTAAASLFLKSVIHQATDLFNLSDNNELSESQKMLVNQFSEDFVAVNSGQSLKNPFVIHLPNEVETTEIAVQGHFEKAPEVEVKVREYNGLAELYGALNHQTAIFLRLIDDDTNSQKILKIRANSIQELKVAHAIAQKDHPQAHVKLHQVQDGQKKTHWRLDVIDPVNEHARPEFSLVQ